MIKSIKIVLLISLVSTSLLFYRCNRKNVDEPKEMTINIFMVAPEGSSPLGKTIGCNDILVPVSKNILIEKNEVESAMSELLNMKNTDELINFVKGPRLFLYAATLSNGVAEVYLKGDFAILDACDIPRIKEQLYATANQFPDVKEVKIFINAELLESYLSPTKQGFN